MSPFPFIGFTCNLVAKVGFSTSLANSCYNEFGIACLWLVNSVPFKQFGGCYFCNLSLWTKLCSRVSSLIPTISVVWVVWRNFLGLELWSGLVTLMLAWEHDHQWMTGKRLVGVLPSLLNCYFLEDVKIHSLSQDMDFWNPTWFAYYFLFQDVKNHSSQESLPQSLPDHADAWPKSKSYTSKLWLLFAVIWKWPIQVAGRYQSGKTSVCCLFKEVNVGYLWIQLWWEYLCWTTCWILTVIWTLILDQLGNWLLTQSTISSSWIFRTQVI